MWSLGWSPTPPRRGLRHVSSATKVGWGWGEPRLGLGSMSSLHMCCDDGQVHLLTQKPQHFLLSSSKSNTYVWAGMSDSRQDCPSPLVKKKKKAWIYSIQLSFGKNQWLFSLQVWRTHEMFSFLQYLFLLLEVVALICQRQVRASQVSLKSRKLCSWATRSPHASSQENTEDAGDGEAHLCPPGTDCHSSVMGGQLSGGLRPAKGYLGPLKGYLLDEARSLPLGLGRGSDSESALLTEDTSASASLGLGRVELHVTTVLTSPLPNTQHLDSQNSCV